MIKFISDMRHLAGVGSKVADAISRPPQQHAVADVAAATFPESVPSTSAALQFARGHARA